MKEEYTIVKPHSKWAEHVKGLYNHTCVWCGRSIEDTDKRMIHAHHIVPKSESEELEFALENGVSLCFWCHMLLHHCQGSDKAKEIEKRIKELKETEIIYTASKEEMAIIKNHAEECGETVNMFIQRAIDETMKRDNIIYTSDFYE